MCGFDALLADSEIVVVALNADEVAASVHATHTCRAAPHREIKDRLTFVRVRLDEVFHQSNRLLGWVDSAAF